MPLADTANEIHPPVEACQATAEAATPSACAAQATGRYIYCVIDCEEPTGFGAIGLPVRPAPATGDQPQGEVFTISHEGLAAVISPTASEKVEISRENILAHQGVMETAMQRGHTVLPVKFNTIAEQASDASSEDRIINKILTGRLDELSGLLVTMSTRVELGVKALWTDMNAVFEEIVRGDQEIRSLRDKLLTTRRTSSGARTGYPTMRGPGLMAKQVKLGELVKKALEVKKQDIEAKLISRLGGMFVEIRRNGTFGDAMFANLALLVEKARQEQVYSALSVFEAERTGLIKLRCVGPVPPSNFIELTINWDNE